MKMGTQDPHFPGRIGTRVPILPEKWGSGVPILGGPYFHVTTAAQPPNNFANILLLPDYDEIAKVSACQLISTFAADAH